MEIWPDFYGPQKNQVIGTIVTSALLAHELRDTTFFYWETKTKSMRGSNVLEVIFGIKSKLKKHHDSNDIYSVLVYFGVIGHTTLSIQKWKLDCGALPALLEFFYTQKVLTHS